MNPSLPEPPIVDTHLHFWDVRTPPEEMIWSWLTPGADHPILGDIDPIKSPRFDLDAAWGEARFSGVAAFVHVQAAIGSPDPIAETRWLEQMRSRGPVPMAIVGHAGLATAEVESQLDAHLAASSAVVGIRDFAVEPLLASGRADDLEAGLTALAHRGLLLDLDCEWPNMAAAADLAERHPDLTIVLEHMGFPRSRDDAYFAQWQHGLARLAAQPNVSCKMSGLGMTDTRFTADSLRRWIATCIDLFGPGRCCVGSNWPIDRLYSSYDGLMATIRVLVAESCGDQGAAVLSTTAARLYRVGGTTAR